ncbi:MAG: cold-shock protein [Sedimentisphaerales bacterium]|nr:cold-shock protein [Sedimentisphaerales bacterium]
MGSSVNRYEKKKGCVFIDPEIKSNIFAHYTSFLDGLNMLEEGQQVTFEVVEDEKVPRSDKVTLKEKSNPLIRFAI